MQELLDLKELKVCREQEETLVCLVLLDRKVYLDLMVSLE